MLSRNDPFYSSKLSIERGKHHAGEFTEHLTAFTDSNPHAFVIEVDPDTGEDLHKIKLIKPMPIEIEGLALDAASNFRNALDQAMFAIVGKMTYFPFGINEADFEKNVTGKSKKSVPVEVINLIRRFKPYLGGNDPLWALNKIGNTNKHGVVVPMATNLTSYTFGDLEIEPGSGPIFIGGNPGWDFEKNEMIVNRFAAGAKYKITANPRISFFIGMHGIPVVEGQEVVTVLNYFSSIVESIVMALEAEWLRLQRIEFVKMHTA